MSLVDPVARNAYRREYYAKDPERILASNRRSWYQRREAKRKHDKALRDEYRARALAVLGGRCAHCGYDIDPRALQIDHVNGGGLRERVTGISSPRLSRMIAKGEADLSKYQILCANCNCIKRIEAGEVRRPVELD